MPADKSVVVRAAGTAARAAGGAVGPVAGAAVVAAEMLTESESRIARGLSFGGQVIFMVVPSYFSIVVLLKGLGCSHGTRLLCLQEGELERII